MGSSEKMAERVVVGLHEALNTVPGTGLYVGVCSSQQPNDLLASLLPTL